MLSNFWQNRDRIDPNGIAINGRGGKEGKGGEGESPRPILAPSVREEKKERKKRDVKRRENQLDTIDHVARHTLVPLEIL